MEPRGRNFSEWCGARGVLSSKPRMRDILEFLQDGLEMGLSASTLRRQAAAINSTLRACSGRKGSSHPYIQRFLRGVSLISPPTIHQFPTWKLNKVLSALMGPPFEPMAKIGLKELTLKTPLLVAITSARRVSELGALSVNPKLCVFHRDRVVLRPDPIFIPKVNTWFHRAHELSLPSFCPNPNHPKEQAWHNLDVRRALRFYTERTREFRLTETLFVKFQGNRKGGRVSTPTLSRWLKMGIEAAYRAIGLEPPVGITAHSIRGAAASAAFEGVCSMGDICRAATWSSPNTFTKHYHIDTTALAEAAFGRRVLESVVLP